MAEVLVVALANFKDLFVQVIYGGLALETAELVGLLPMLELVIAAAVEGVVAFAALKQGLLGADLASLSLAADKLLAHCYNSNVQRT